MTKLFRLLDTTATSLGPNRVEAIAGTSKKARDGHIVEMRSMDTSAFLRSGTILWNHDPDHAVGIPVSGCVDSAGDLRLMIDFAPDGASRKADEVRNLVKSGIVRNLSIGFDVLDAEPLDPKSPRGGLRVTRSELLEVSFVGVPADVGAVVTARSSDRSGRVLSAVNAAGLRSAHDLAERARSTLDDALEADRGAVGAGKAFSAGIVPRLQEAHDLAKRARTSLANVLEDAGEGARAGKVLSAVNAGVVRDAHGSADVCRQALSEVLAEHAEELSGAMGAPVRSARDLATRCGSALADVLTDAGEELSGDVEDRAQRKRQLAVLELGLIGDLQRLHPGDQTLIEDDRDRRRRVRELEETFQRAATPEHQRRVREVIDLIGRAG